MQKIKLFLFSFRNFLNFRKSNKDVIFFSESLFYFNFYKELYNELKKNNLEPSIITLSIDEYNFHKKHNRKIYYLGNNFLRNFYLINIKCKYFILTMTDLGNNIPKSKKILHYIYFFHSVASLHKIYTKNAFKNYDVMFLNGPYQKKEMQKINNIYNNKPSKMVDTGYFYLDYLEKESNKKILNENKILIAPSWNYNKINFFDNCLNETINILINAKFDLILRPHPEHFKRSAQVINIINSKYVNSKSLIFDDHFDNLNSMEKSNILITDNSTIAIEFALTFYRKVIYIVFEDKIHNKDYLKIDNNTIEDNFKNDFGIIVNYKNINQLPEICYSIIKQDKNDYQKRIDNFKIKNFYNLNKTVSIAKDYIFNNLNKNSDS